MKKLNRKGFTLIELLAIIVILAIIMVVTVPTVLSSMGTAREDMFQTSANTVADWVEKQYTQTMMQTYDTAFTGVCPSTTSAATTFCAGGVTKTAASGKTLNDDATSKAFLKAAGVDPTNYSKLVVKITNGRACVTLTASNIGDFKDYVSNPKSSTGC